MVGWWVVGWLVGWWVVGWLVVCSRVGWLLVGWLVGWSAVWLVGWLVGWFVGLLVGWLVGWVVGWFVAGWSGWLFALAPGTPWNQFLGVPPVSLFALLPFDLWTPCNQFLVVLSVCTCALGYRALDLETPWNHFLWYFFGGLGPALGL